MPWDDAVTVLPPPPKYFTRSQASSPSRADIEDFYAQLRKPSLEVNRTEALANRIVVGGPFHSRSLAAAWWTWRAATKRRTQRPSLHELRLQVEGLALNSAMSHMRSACTDWNQPSASYVHTADDYCGKESRVSVGSSNSSSHFYGDNDESHWDQRDDYRRSCLRSRRGNHAHHRSPYTDSSQDYHDVLSDEVIGDESWSRSW